ncbi:unnamed protein product [Musa textilis]
MLKSKAETSLHYVILDMGAVGSIDSSGTGMLKELKESLGRRGLQLVLANPGSEAMKKMDKSKVLETIGQDWIFLTVGEAAAACNFMLRTCKSGMVHEAERENIV